MAKKVFIAIGIVLLLAGLTVGVVGVALANGEFPPLSTGMAEAKRTVYTTTAAFDRVTIDAENESITVTVGETNELTVRYTEYEGSTYTPVEDGAGGFTFTMRENNDWLRFDLFAGLARLGDSIEVTLPKSFGGDLTLKTRNASVEAEGGSFGALVCGSENGHIDLTGLSSASAELSTTNSSVELQGLAVAGTLTVNDQNGSITLLGVEAGDGKLETRNSKIQLKGVTVGGSLTATSGNGSIELEDVRAKEVGCTTTNSRITLENVAADTVSAVTANARIDVEAVDAADVTLRTANGSIGGTLAGSEDDYRVDARVRNGDCNVRGSDGDRSLTVETDNGSVSLAFTGESERTDTDERFSTNRD